VAPPHDPALEGAAAIAAGIVDQHAAAKLKKRRSVVISSSVKGVKSRHR